MPDDGVAKWKDYFSPFDRVLQVAGTVSEPQPVSQIARNAAVEEETATEYLELLVDTEVLRKTEGDKDPVYGQHPSYTRAVTIHDLVAEHDVDELAEIRAQMKEQITAWRNRFNVRSPEELRAQAIDKEHQQEQAEMVETANEWSLIRYRLELVQNAVAKSRDGDHNPR